MTTVAFTVPGKPVGKQRPRLGKNGCVYTPKETKAHERKVRGCCLCAMVAAGVPKLYGGPVTISVDCFFPDARRRDADNVLKLALDALNGFLWVDDSQVVRATVTKAIDRARPRTEIAVELGQFEAQHPTLHESGQCWETFEWTDEATGESGLGTRMRYPACAAEGEGT